jgi:hypothetical protein
MVIDVRRAFAGQGLEAGNGVFAPKPLPSGELDATQATGGAVMRRFESVGRAIDDETRALVAQGDAIQDLGGSLLASGSRIAQTFGAIEERRNQAMHRHQAATARTQFMRNADSILQEAIEGSDPAGGNIEATVREKLQESRDKLLSGIQNEPLRLALGDDMDFVSAKTEILARKRQAKKEGDFLRRELNKRVGSYGAQAAKFRGADQEQMIGVAVDDIRDAIDEGTITPHAGEKAIAAFRANLLTSTITVDVAKNPALAAQRLEGGVYDNLIVSDLDRVNVQSKINQGLKVHRAVEAGVLGDLMKDDLASREATGRGVPGLRQRIANLGDERALADYDEKRAQADVFFSTMQDIRYTAPQEALASVMASKPEAGSEGFAFNQKLHLAAVKAFQARQKALADDPAGYAATNPAIKTREQNIALQQSMGITDYSLFTKAEAGTWVQKYEQAPDDGKIDLLSALVTEAGKHGRAGMEDLIEAKLPPSATVLMMHAGDNQMRPVLARTLEAERVGRTELEKGLEATAITELKKSVMSALADFRGTALAGGSGGASLANQAQDSVTLLALSYMGGGNGKTGAMDAVKAAETAAKMLFNDHFSYQYGYRVPWQYHANSVGAYGDWLLENGLENADPGQIDPRFSADLQHEQWLETIRERGRWINTADGEGLVLMTEEGVPVVNIKGEPLRLDFKIAEERWRALTSSKPSEGSTQDIGATTTRELFQTRHTRQSK